jgi:hypothetical protein
LVETQKGDPGMETFKGTCRAAVLLMPALLGACCATPPPKQALDSKAIEKVQAEIKRQIGIYMLAPAPNAGDSANYWCGKGAINFDIASIKAELTTTIETINGGGLKLKIPVSAVTIGPSASAKMDTTNTQTLTYNLWPVALGEQLSTLGAPSQADIDGAPIAKVLLALRDAIIESAKKGVGKGPQPCFADYNPQKPSSDAGNTFKLGLTFVTDTTGGIDVSVGVLDLNASTEMKGTTGNTLTIAFVQRGLAKLQRARDRMDAECKYPKDPKGDACKAAKKAFHDLQVSDGGIGIFEEDF